MTLSGARGMEFYINNNNNVIISLSLSYSLSLFDLLCSFSSFK